MDLVRVGGHFRLEALSQNNVFLQFLHLRCSRGARRSLRHDAGLRHLGQALVRERLRPQRVQVHRRLGGLRRPLPSTGGGRGLFPPDIFTARNVGFLMLSSTIGILVGDWTWLESLRLVGARRVIVVDTCKPFLAALFGWALLGERLLPAAWGGLALTAVGVLVVSLEKEGPPSLEDEDDEASKRSTEPDDEDLEEGTDDGVQTVTISRADGADGTISQNVVASVVAAAEVGGSQHESVVGAVRCANKLVVDANVSDNESGGGPDHVEAETDAGNSKLRGKDGATSKRTRKRLTPARKRRGYAMAVLNVVLDTYGSVLTKEYGVGMTTWEINLIRFGFAAVAMVSLSLLLQMWQHVNTRIVLGNVASKGEVSETDGDETARAETVWYLLPRMKRRSWFQVSLGVLFVTFLCPALSMYALFQIALALALTLGSIGPLYALPLAWLLQKEKPTWRGWLGAATAVAGVVVLSLWGHVPSSQ